MTFSNILCPVDGSDHAERALELARDLASRYGAALTVMHVEHGTSHAASDLRDFAKSEGLMRRDHEPRMPAGATASEMVASATTLAHHEVEDVEAAQRMGETLLEEARQRASLDAEAHAVLSRGDPAGAILEAAEARGVDLIVMGSRGLGNVKSLLLGSVSGKVCNQARCTCITVK